MLRQLVTMDGREYSLQEFELPALQSHEVRVRVQFAALKQGTEAHLLDGSVFDRKKWDAQYRMFVPKTESEATVGLEKTVGNMVVGEVAAVGNGVTRFREGDQVFGYGPVREEHQAGQDNWFALGDLSFDSAVCVDPGHVALVAVRDGNIRIGDDVAVYGLGAIGLLAVQLARAGGAARVFAVDPVAHRRDYAAAHGADKSFDPAACDPAWEIKCATGKKGVDVSVETSGNGRALHDAIRSIRQCGTVVHVPWGPKDGCSLHLDEEFHLNRPTLIGSQAVWDNPDRSYPLWDQARAYQTVIDLFSANILTAEGLVTPLVPFSQIAATMSTHRFDPQDSIKIGILFS